MDIDAHRKYFHKKKPSGSITLLVFGLLFLSMGISSPDAFMWVIIGLLMSVGGICLIIKFNHKHSDSAIDDFCDSQANEYFIAKKSIVDSKGEKITDIVCSSEYCFGNYFTARLAKCGKDKVWRSSIFEMSCMFFTEKTVYYFCKRISLINEEKAENQKEFLLHDIQMVSLNEVNQTVGVSISIPGNEKIYINCKNKQEALKLCEKINSYKKELTQ